MFRGSGNYSSDDAKELARLKKENRDLRDAVEILKKAKNELSDNCSNRDEAIEYLVKETNLSEDECSAAYDILVKIDFSKNIQQ